MYRFQICKNNGQTHRCRHALQQIIGKNQSTIQLFDFVTVGNGDIGYWLNTDQLILSILDIDLHSSNLLLRFPLSWGRGMG
jgi:hypothetical protein